MEELKFKAVDQKKATLKEIMLSVIHYICAIGMFVSFIAWFTSFFLKSTSLLIRSMSSIFGSGAGFMLTFQGKKISKTELSRL